MFKFYYDVRKPVSLTVNKIKVIIDGDSLLKKDIVDDNVSIELANYLTLTMPTSGMTKTGIRYILTGLAIMMISLVLLAGRRYRAKISDNEGGERK